MTITALQLELIILGAAWLGVFVGVFIVCLCKVAGE